MRFEALRSQAPRPGPLTGLDARVKLVATLLYVLAVVATPPGAWGPLASEGLILAFVVGLAGLAPRALLVRWLGFLALFGFLALMVGLAHPMRAELGTAVVVGSVLIKNSLAFLALVTLAGVTLPHKLLEGLGRLGLPAPLQSTLGFMHRYLFILADELDRMAKARRARTFRRSGRLDWGLLTGLIGLLFVRAFERGERVHAAMLARGWDGTTRTLDR